MDVAFVCEPIGLPTDAQDQALGPYQVTVGPLAILQTVFSPGAPVAPPLSRGARALHLDPRPTAPELIEIGAGMVDERTPIGGNKSGRRRERRPADAAPSVDPANAHADSTELHAASILRFLNRWQLEVSAIGFLRIQPVGDPLNAREFAAFLLRLNDAYGETLPDVITFDFAEVHVQDHHWIRIQEQLEALAAGMGGRSRVVKSGRRLSVVSLLSPGIDRGGGAGRGPAEKNSESA